MGRKQVYNGLIRDFDFRQTSVRIFYAVILIVGISASVLGFAPLIWLVFSGFKEMNEFAVETTLVPRTFNINNYLKTWNDLRFARYYINSLFSVLGSVACAVLFNGLLGYALSKIKPRGSNIIHGMIMWSLLIPGTTAVVPLFVNISRLGLTGTFIPLWFIAGANAFNVVLFKNFFDDLPQSLIEAAKIDGAKDITIFVRIAIPLSQAVIIVIALAAINMAWSDFLLPFLVLSGSPLETVMVRLFEFRAGRTNEVEVLRAIVFSIIPPLVLFFIFQRYITQQVLSSGIKG